MGSQTATRGKHMTITETGREFFDACDSGKGWDGCSQFCHDDATFSCQAGTLADIATIEDYADWLRDFFTPVPDGHYEMKSFSTDEERSVVTAFAVFKGTQTGPGPLDPPTGKSVATEYAYAMEFDGDRIRHITKVWNDVQALTELGWA
jgi:predicted ester cyclase